MRTDFFLVFGLPTLALPRQFGQLFAVEIYIFLYDSNRSAMFLWFDFRLYGLSFSLPGITQQFLDYHPRSPVQLRPLFNIYLPTCFLATWFSTYLSTYLSIYQFIYYISILSTCLSICSSVYLLICLLICLSICLFICLPICLATYLSIYPCTYLPD